MIWDCMSWKGVGELIKIERKLNNKHYQNILHGNMSMSVVKFKKERKEWVFQEDKGPNHTNMSANK